MASTEENDQLKEHFWAVGVNARNTIQYIELVSLGTLNASLVHPRESFRLAIQKSVACIFFVHNHPSGDAEPSAEDRAVTRRLKEAGEILGIQVVDHLVITATSFSSTN